MYMFYPVTGKDNESFDRDFKERTWFLTKDEMLEFIRRNYDESNLFILDKEIIRDDDDPDRSFELSQVSRSSNYKDVFGRVIKTDNSVEEVERIICYNERTL